MLAAKMLTRRLATYTTRPEVTDPFAVKIPTFRVIDEQGEVVKGAEKYANLDKETLKRMYKNMIEVSEIDTISYDMQRQGQISFYMQNIGEEGLQVGVASGLNDMDWISPQYRELGMFLWRGFPIQKIFHQLFGNREDQGEGKQMPVHYGSTEHRI